MKHPEVREHALRIAAFQALGYPWVMARRKALGA